MMNAEQARNWRSIQNNPAAKLTAGYLGLIMFLSIGFSVLVYNISSAQLRRGLKRPPIGYDVELPQTFSMFENYRLKQIDEAEDNLRANLILFNLVVLVGGGALSYFFARQTIQPIEEALESQKRFTADASHELRTPLTAMQTEIEVALRDAGLSKKEARELLASNLDEVIKVRSLVDGLLRLARNDGVLENAAPAQLMTIAESAIKRSTKLAQKKSINIITELENLTSRVDGANIEELILILLDNAIKYSPEKSEVSLSLKKRGNCAVISISDQGPGIAKSELPYIFDRFYRGDPSRNKHAVDGFGLGLSIAQQIACSHGSEIVVKSQMSRGSSFSLAIPISK
ncbi:MAG: HAMP domain-containing sensor histidine kinase [bacterium]